MSSLLISFVKPFVVLPEQVRGSSSFTGKCKLRTCIPRPISTPRRAVSPCVLVTAQEKLSRLKEEKVTDIPISTVPLFTQSTFGALGLNEEIVQHMQSMKISNPTGIQSRGIPPILGGADVILGAATGSGKTFAYLLPVVQLLKQAEQMRCDGDPPLRVARRPRALVLIPTRELTEQVEEVARKLSHHAKFRVVGALSGGAGSFRKLKEKVGAPLDVLVATTGRLLQLLEDKAVDIRFVKHVVIDEVDTMFDKGFEKELKKILWWCQGANSTISNRPQFIAAGATHPNGAQEIYAEVFPNAKRIDVDLHKTPRGLKQRFIYVEPNKKMEEIVTFLGEVRRDGVLTGGRMMIFCNTMDSCRFLGHFLTECGYRVACIHGDVPVERREMEYDSFRSGEKELIVCTDMAARGLDNLRVGHVALFDFPNSAVDYLHRAGRTARAGATGRVTSFVLKKDMKLARAIQRASREGVDALESARMSRLEDEKSKRHEKELKLERKRTAESGEQEKVTELKRGKKFNPSKRFFSPSAVRERGRTGSRGGRRGRR